MFGQSGTHLYMHLHCARDTSRKNQFVALEMDQGGKLIQLTSFFVSSQHTEEICIISDPFLLFLVLRSLAQSRGQVRHTCTAIFMTEHC